MIEQSLGLSKVKNFLLHKSGFSVQPVFVVQIVVYYSMSCSFTEFSTVLVQCFLYKLQTFVVATNKLKRKKVLQNQLEMS